MQKGDSSAKPGFQLEGSSTSRFHQECSLLLLLLLLITIIIIIIVILFDVVLQLHFCLLLTSLLWAGQPTLAGCPSSLSSLPDGNLS